LEHLLVVLLLLALVDVERDAFDVLLLCTLDL
jgi:hypothetical protein